MPKKDYSSAMSGRSTPQSEPIPGKNMVKNDAGGYVFEPSDKAFLERFVLTGTEGGTYYVNENKHTTRTLNETLKIIEKNPKLVVDVATEMSVSGRSPRNDISIFLIATVAQTAKDAEARRYALSQMNKVCRTGTHVFQFVNDLKEMGGLGRAKRRAISEWYTNKSDKDLAYQMAKYRQRDGWSHRDTLLLSHTKPVSETQQQLFKWAVAGYKPEECPTEVAWVVDAYQKLQQAGTEKEVLSVLDEYPNSPREIIPTEYLNKADVLEAMLPGMPMTALIRNLANMTRLGVLNGMNSNVKTVVEKLGNPEYLKAARIHPVNVLIAKATYDGGRGIRGKNTWSPVQHVTEALEDAFYKSFEYAEPSGKNTLIGLDVSASMGMHSHSPVPNLTVRDLAAAMCMSTARLEPWSMIRGFSTQFIDMKIGRRDSLNSVIKKTSGLSFGGTDCAQPMLWAQANNQDIETFIIYTDNETWYGNTHPCKALENYRKASGKKDAKLIVCAMSGSLRTIADPNDPGSLDISGFDASTPKLITEFSKG